MSDREWNEHWELIFANEPKPVEERRVPCFGGTIPLSALPQKEENKLSLHGTFNVGYKEIGSFEIVRKTNTTCAALDPDSVSDYSYVVRHVNMDGTVDVKEGMISHRYGDGALELLAKVFIMCSPVE